MRRARRRLRLQIQIPGAGCWNYRAAGVVRPESVGAAVWRWRAAEVVAAVLDADDQDAPAADAV